MERYKLEYNATTTKIFDMPPYGFFAVMGVVFSSSLFILLLLKYGYSIPIYTKISLLSGIGLLAGAKLFGFLAGLYIALTNRQSINLNTFANTGFVFYGALIGFLTAFLLICKKWHKHVDYRVIDLVAVCIPLCLFWARLGCFSGGCCYGIEDHSIFSILYTNDIMGEIVTVSRIPIQLVEAVLSMIIFFVLLTLLSKGKFKGSLLVVYLFIYAPIRIVLEFFRSDFAHGVWNGVSFSQLISIIIITICFIILFKRKDRIYV